MKSSGGCGCSGISARVRTVALGHSLAKANKAVAASQCLTVPEAERAIAAGLSMASGDVAVRIPRRYALYSTTTANGPHSCGRYCCRRLWAEALRALREWEQMRLEATTLRLTGLLVDAFIAASLALSLESAVVCSGAEARNPTHVNWAC